MGHHVNPVIVGVGADHRQVHIHYSGGDIAGDVGQEHGDQGLQVEAVAAFPAGGRHQGLAQRQGKAIGGIFGNDPGDFPVIVFHPGQPGGPGPLRRGAVESREAVAGQGDIVLADGDDCQVADMIAHPPRRVGDRADPGFNFVREIEQEKIFLKRQAGAGGGLQHQRVNASDAGRGVIGYAWRQGSKRRVVGQTKRIRRHQISGRTLPVNFSLHRDRWRLYALLAG